MSSIVSSLLEVGRKELRSFGIVFALFLLIFGYFIFPYWFELDKKIAVVGISLIIAIMGFLQPRVLIIVYVPWMLLGQILGYINSRILLVVVYYALLVPTGLILKMIGKDPLAKKMDSSITSYRISVDKKNLVEQMKYPF